MLCQAGRRHSSFREKVRILAVASTNAAVDNLLEGLLERGIKAVRVGAPARIRPDLRYASVEAQAEQTEQGKQARTSQRCVSPRHDARVVACPHAG